MQLQYTRLCLDDSGFERNVIILIHCEQNIRINIEIMKILL